MTEIVEDPFEPESGDDLFVRRVMRAVAPKDNAAEGRRTRRPITLGLAAAIARGTAYASKVTRLR
jgi:hypothetical protein